MVKSHFKSESIRPMVLLIGLLALGCSPATVDFTTVDLKTELSGPRILINGGAEFTNDLNVQITLESPDTHEYFLSPNSDCANGIWVPQVRATPYTLNHLNESNSVYAKFRSKYGIETLCVSASIVHDGIAPHIQFVQKPQAQIKEREALFEVTGQDERSGISHFECSNAQGVFERCDSRFTKGNLEDKEHALQVRAVDRAGNRSKPEAARWIVDGTAPVVTLVQTPPALTNSSSALFRFQGDDGSGVGVAGFSCSLDRRRIPVCTTPLTWTSLTEGEHLFEVRAFDHVGNYSAPVEYRFSVDQVPAGDFSILGITSLDGDTKVDAWLKGATPQGLWTASQGAVEYRVSVLDSRGRVQCAEVTVAATQYAFDSRTCLLPDLQRFTFRVVAMDGAQNGRTRDFAFHVDRTPPQIQITGPLTPNERVARFNLNVTDAAPGVLEAANCIKSFTSSQGSNQTQQNCLNQNSIVFNQLEYGQHSLRVVATDLAGNMSEQTVEWRLRPTICDPFAEDTSLCRGGLVGEIYYLDAERQSQFVASNPKSVSFFFDHGIRVEAILRLSKLFGSTRRFNQGFPTANGGTVQDNQGNTLIEYFAFRLNSVVKLNGEGEPSQRDEPGQYRIAILSDDGTILRLQQTQNGPYTVLIDNDGNHATKMKCATQLVEMRENTRLPIQVDYYQGPRDYISLVMMWKKVTDPSEREPHCDYEGTDGFFGPYPHQDFTNHRYGELLRRGWKTMGENNFIDPVTR